MRSFGSTEPSNNGVILNSSAAKVQSLSVGSGNVTVAIQSYVGHNYQLQRTPSLSPATWQNAGAAQQGNGAVINFIDNGGGSDPQGFYRVQLSP